LIDFSFYFSLKSVFLRIKTAQTIVVIKNSIDTLIPYSSPNTTTRIERIKTVTAISIKIPPSINKPAIPSELFFAILILYYKV